MKLKLLLLMIFLTAATSIVSTGFQDCYGDWADAFDNATYAYENEWNTCAMRLIPWMCRREVDAAYDHAINIAGDAYSCCVMGC